MNDIVDDAQRSESMKKRKKRHNFTKHTTFNGFRAVSASSDFAFIIPTFV
jgi:hypothetical protein